MPELPEVQNFVNSIEKKYVGLNINKIVFHRPNLRYPFEKEKLQSVFAKGVKLLRCYREGKQLILQTQKGAVNISLGMTGSFKPAILANPEKHEHLTLYFESGEALAYVDPRRFGFWKIREDNSKRNFCDPLIESDLLKMFSSQKISTLNRSVKDMLMDQSLIGGIGNIYACEVLFRAQISPLLPCHRLAKKQWLKLAQSIPPLLQLAIEQGGSSIATYRSLNGEKGNFQNLHLVYERHGENCVQKNCKEVIKRIVQSGRSSWYCPACQK